MVEGQRGAVRGAQLDGGHCRHPREEDADGGGEMGFGVHPHSMFEPITAQMIRP
jgi:hypothetical protein